MQVEPFSVLDWYCSNAIIIEMIPYQCVFISSTRPFWKTSCKIHVACSDFLWIDNSIKTSFVIMLGDSDSGNASFSSSWFGRVDWSPYFSECKWPWYVAMVLGRSLSISWGVNPGHVEKWLFFIAFTKVDTVGERQDACEYCASSQLFCFLRMIKFSL